MRFAVLFATILLLHAALVRANSHGAVTDLTQNCAEQLDELWADFYTDANWNATLTQDGSTFLCNGTCLGDCRALLELALDETSDISDCPDEDDVQDCFRIASDEWESFVGRCELFSDMGQQPTSEGEGEGGRRRLLDGEGEAGEGASPTGQYASGPFATVPGCFPYFANAEQFEEWLDSEPGTYPGYKYNPIDIKYGNNNGWITVGVLGGCGLAILALRSYRNRKQMAKLPAAALAADSRRNPLVANEMGIGL